MAQKDKVKELVGRGLNSYHTKALQQMDRIEKKNKEQNHKISILSNELDNDYLTKTEEGSVISLEHSKEGMVYLDELQGNTLVNYCTDGSKEITLNGDIDVEGVSVTTTEGVDNGKVDIMCEGNTLVNLANHPNSFTVTRTEGQAYRSYDIPLLRPLKANTTYTIYLTVENNGFDHNPFTSIVIGQGNTDNWSCRIYWNREFGKKDTDKGLGRHKAIFTTHSRVEESSHKWIKFIFETYPEYNTTMKDIVLLEGEHNEDIDNFIGMKSVGQDDENGHKIEILSRKSRENLLIGGGFEVFATKDSYANMNNPISIDPNIDLQSLIGKTLLLSVYKHTEGEGQKNPTMNEIMGKRFGIHGTIRWGKSGDINSETTTYPLVLVDNDWGYINTIQYKVEKITPPVGYDTIKSFFISFQPNSKPSENNDATWILKNAKLEIVESTTDTPSEWCPHLSEDTTYQYHNKKEILLNEPLRSVGDVKDRFVKIDGKWYIERNCVEFEINSSSVNIYSTWHGASSENGSTIGFLLNKGMLNIAPYRPNSGGIFTKSSIIKSVGYDNLYWDDKEGIAIVGGMYSFGIKINKNKLTTVDQRGFVQWLQNNPIKVIYITQTPTYEPLELESTLNTYNDITHISNNSIIPCVMKIKNTGYNAIIKPSTLYTVALDTNKSGTVGIDLGGMKTVTTNNVVTITTPAILSDDSLRLFGKGIKGSKVRLLEGDKTNWIPSFFEGMKSSFEDKDNVINLKLTNENLFEVNNKDFLNESIINSKTLNGVKFTFNNDGSFNTKGTATSIITLMGEDCLSYLQHGKQYITNMSCQLEYKDGTKKWTSLFTVDKCTMSKIKLYIQIKEGQIEDRKIVPVLYNSDKVLNIIPHKSNKIQFSSIEPLRKWDKFIFKDGRLMIERRSATFTLNSKNGYGLSEGGWENKTDVCTFEHYKPTPTAILDHTIKHYADTVPSLTFHQQWVESGSKGREGISTHEQGGFVLSIKRSKLKTQDVNGLDEYLRNNPIKVTYQTVEPTYEEIPHELQKIILEGYENGTLFLDTNIPPTATVTYAGETPIVKATKLNKTEVLSNTEDINDNIIPYLMDMDYRVVMLQLATEELEGGVSMARLFGGTYEMIKRDILSKRLSRQEYGYRLADYFNAGKLTEQEVRELEDLR